MIEGIAKLPNIVTLDVGEYQGLLVDLMENFITTVVRCIVKIVGRSAYAHVLFIKPLQLYFRDIFDDY